MYKIYKIQPGDTLENIALKFDTTVEVLNRLNDLKDFIVGEEIIVPNNKEMIIKTFKKWGQKYPNAGYGGRFFHWVLSDNPLPYTKYRRGRTQLPS